MNVFVLCTGRCGSTTFIRACRHASNYSSGHESRAHLVGPSRLQYPPDHIEADNRLSWFLGRLEKAYGDDAIYVHLVRDRAATARSFVKRWEGGIMKGYWAHILEEIPATSSKLEISADYWDTVNTNIEGFLKDKTRKMTFALENATEDFTRFWELIGAEGDLQAALGEWETSHNASEAWASQGPLLSFAYKCKRILSRLPAFIRYA
jgi:hypothetical protein